MVSTERLTTKPVFLVQTDIAGSTALLKALGADGYAFVQEEHRTTIRRAVLSFQGQELFTQGDAFGIAFGSAQAAVLAAIQFQRDLEQHAWPEQGRVTVRAGIHVGTLETDGDGLGGHDLDITERITSAGHGGQILVSRAVIAETALPVELEVRSLGRRTLKGISAPIEICQIVGPGLADGFPPIRTGDRRPSNLPSQSTSFVGRNQEIAAIRSRLRRESGRVLSLLGPGGIGKTRLALEAASGLLDEFDDGVWLVSLASVTEPDLIPSRIAEVLGVQEAAGVPIALTLRQFLAARHLLIILDNCEQVAHRLAIVDALLEAARGLRILATSRDRLGLSHEQVLAIGTLEVPTPEAIRRHPESVGEFSAVRLFVDRCQAVRPEITLNAVSAGPIASIVQRVDGLPLAIELAAARARRLSIADIAAQLDRRLSLLTGGARDLPSRQQTLRATIAWSYDLLSGAEQALFRTLAYFVGGATAAAAAAVGQLSQPVADDLLNRLQEQSLLQQRPGADGVARFVMLETIREYGVDALGDEQQRTATAHLDYYTAVAESAGEAVAGTAEPIHQLTAEHENVRQALLVATERGESSTAFRLAHGSLVYWGAAGHFQEARRWIESIFALTEETPLPDQSLAQLAYDAGFIGFRIGDLIWAKPHLDAALEHFERLADKRGTLESLRLLGTVLRNQGETSQALELYRRSLAMARDLGDERNEAVVLNLLAVASRVLGNYDDAFEFYDQALRLNRRLGRTYAVAETLNNLGFARLQSGDRTRAKVCFDEALKLFRQVQSRNGIALVTENLGDLAFVSEDLSIAIDHYRSALDDFVEAGSPRAALGVIGRIAEIASELAQHERAVTLANATRRQLHQRGLVLRDYQQTALEAVLLAGQSALSEDQFQASVEHAEQLDLNTTIALARSLSPIVR